MYLGEIVSRIQSQADFAPQSTPGFQKYLVDQVNDAYQDIWFQKDWTFNTKTIEQKVFPDLTPTNAAILFSAQTSSTAPASYPMASQNGAKYFNLSYSGSIGGVYARIDPRYYWQLFGSYIEFDGRDYRIVDVVPNTGSGVIKFYVDDVVISSKDNGAFTLTGSNDWKIKFREYKMPHDLAEIMDVSWSNTRDVNALRYGQATSLPERNANDLAINFQLQAAKPFCYIPKSYSFMNDTSEQFSTTISTASASNYYDQTTHYFAWERFDLATGASSGITEPLTVNITGSTVSSITFTDARTLPVGQARRLLFGIKRTNYNLDTIKWFYATYVGTNSMTQEWTEAQDFTWRYDEEEKVITATEYLTYQQVIASGNEGWRGNQMTLYNGHINRKGIIFYPRISSTDHSEVKTGTNGVNDIGYAQDSIATIRYLYKPVPLEEKYDSPMIPAEFHHLLIHKVLENLCLKFDKQTQAAYYSRKYETMLRNFITRYGNERNTIAMRSNSMGIAGGFYYRRGIINYQGS